MASRWGSEGTAPCCVVASAPAAQAKRTAVSRSSPAAILAARAPQNASPAAVVSIGVDGKGGVVAHAVAGLQLGARRTHRRDDGPGPGRQQGSSTAERLDLVLVGDDDVGGERRVEGRSRHGRRVEDRRRAGAASQGQAVGDGRQRDLELQEQHRRAREVVDGQRAVGAGDHDDRVLARRVDRDQRSTGRTGLPRGGAGVHAGGGELGEEALTGLVVAHGADERRAGTGSSRRDGLVQPLAPGVLGVRRPEHRLAGARQDAGGGDQIEVGAPDDADVEPGVSRRGHAPRSVRSAGSRRRDARPRSRHPRSRTRGCCGRTPGTGSARCTRHRRRGPCASRRSRACGRSADVGKNRCVRPLQAASCIHSSSADARSRNSTAAIQLPPGWNLAGQRRRDDDGTH